MQKLNDLSRSLAPLEPDGTLIAVIEMSQSSSMEGGSLRAVARAVLCQSIKSGSVRGSGVKFPGPTRQNPKLPRCNTLADSCTQQNTSLFDNLVGARASNAAGP